MGEKKGREKNMRDPRTFYLPSLFCATVSSSGSLTGVGGLVEGLVGVLAGGPGGAGWVCSFSSWDSSLADIFSASTTGDSLEERRNMKYSMEPGDTTETDNKFWTGLANGDKSGMLKMTQPPS